MGRSKLPEILLRRHGLHFSSLPTRDPSRSTSRRQPNSSEASWLFNIALTQSNGSGGFSTPQVAELKRQLLSFIPTFLAAVALWAAAKRLPEGYGICATEPRHQFSFPRRRAFSALLPMHLRTSHPILHWMSTFLMDWASKSCLDVRLNAAKFASSAATTPSPAALPLFFATGLIVLGLVSYQQAEEIG